MHVNERLSWDAQPLWVYGVLLLKASAVSPGVLLCVLQSDFIFLSFLELLNSGCELALICTAQVSHL